MKGVFLYGNENHVFQLLWHRCSQKPGCRYYWNYNRKTNITEYIRQSFSTLNAYLYRLKDWLKSHHCFDVCMESTSKLVRISKAEQYLKPLLVQCALSAIKNKSSYFGRKYSKIKKRRGYKKAIIAIARMMLVSIYHMILTGEEFQPTDYESFMNPKSNDTQSLIVEKH